ncbi:MAG: pilus assembly protein N-terminal domain-containing protein [Tepidisphaeraceae bacterium]|jgi:pilus assembly protein CpaC
MSQTKKSKIGRKSVLALGAALAMWALAWPATVSTRADATTEPSVSTSEDQSITTVVIQPGKAIRKTFDERVKRANILAPDIADVIPLGTNELLLTAKKSGSTQLIVWLESDQTQIFNVEVATPVAILQKRLLTLFPQSKITVEDANGTITLTGQVHDLDTARRAESISLPYSGTKQLVDLLEVGGGQQVMLKVKFAEVSKGAERTLGFNFGGSDGMSVFGGGQGPNTFGLTAGVPAGVTAVPFAAGAPNLLTLPTSLATSMLGAGGFGKVAFDYFVDALEQNNLLRTLAEPTLVTTSGQQATFLAGGLFPYPVPQAGTGGGTTVTIQFQQYGVQLKFTPIVLGNGRIRLKVNPDVSELDYSHTVSLDGTSVPGLTERTVDTTVELAEGQTYALAGLLQDTVSATNNQFPILGDVPVLGALFRSVDYQKNQTELVVLVTPVLVHGMDPGDVTPVPGEKWRDPNSAQLYLLHDLGGEEAPPPPARPEGATDQAPQFEGPAGFQPPPAGGK